ncbi:2-dehydropantoate 2-reductase [Agromyces sp. NPDC049794]|uniref:ketopantoate reductase family protein n=1 Tax=unclassified Agromyces TaxID=2639701 RepID=UPI0033FD24AD
MPAAATTTSPNIAIVGPGAVGGLIAALLNRDGADVVVVAREASARLIASHGLTVESAQYGTWTSDVPAVPEIPEGAPVILTTKAYAVLDVAPTLAAAHPVVTLSLLNGVDHVAELRRAAPGLSVVGGAIAVEAARRSPTVIEHRSPFARITVPDAVAASPLVRALAHAGIEVGAGGSEAEVLWRKLRFLAPFALLTTRTQTGIGEALAADVSLAASLLEEVAAVTTAEGLPATGDALRGILEGMPPSMRSSLQADVAAGGPNELDAIAGAVERAAAARDIPTPTLTSLIAELAS